MALPWEYTYIGQPWKTQRIARQVQNELWNNSPANWGVGDDDLGTVSAWYVWSAMGFYPQTPGTADLALGSPLFTNVTITLGNGKKMVVNAPKAATDAPYVQSATLNGSTWNNAYLPPSFVSDGGTLNLDLGTSANTGWATAPSSAPPSYRGNGGPKPPGPPPLPTGPVRSGIAGKCLDVDQGSSADGTKIQTWSCNNSAAQQFALTPDGNLRGLGKCAEISGGTENHASVVLWSCHGGPNQKWTYNASTKALVDLQRLHQGTGEPAVRPLPGYPRIQ
ncbi:glycoside hydrolase domain-containing protein [Streptomyces sp. NPDC086010]|uniref:glycoside hydrolase domain-containing protein n=1 Tax=Streptomyces sp. NPDC086010 TaxID=3365745 RepID=UPI0037D42F6C